jgi:hypothetical protein
VSPPWLPGSTAPKRRRQRQWPTALVEEIRRLRTLHPNLAGARTIGRLIADAPDKMRSRPPAYGAPGKVKALRQPRLRKPRHFRAERAGHCVALDSIELRHDGQHRYLITCTDLHSHFAWAWATRSHASAAAAQFFRLVQAVFPFAIEAVLTNLELLRWLSWYNLDRPLQPYYRRTQPQNPQLALARTIPASSQSVQYVLAQYKALDTC